MQGVGGSHGGWEKGSSSRDRDDWVDVEVSFSTLDTFRRGRTVVFDIVAECSRGRDCQVDVNGSMYELGFIGAKTPRSSATLTC